MPDAETSCAVIFLCFNKIIDVTLIQSTKQFKYMCLHVLNQRQSSNN